MKKGLISLLVLILLVCPMMTTATERKVDPAKLQNLGVQMVDKRVTAITKYDGLLAKTKNISQPTLDKLKAELNRVNTELTALKTEILGETDTAALTEDIKSIVNNYRVYHVFLPQSAGLVAVDRLKAFDAKLRELITKLSSKADELAGQSKDVTEIKNLISIAEGQLTAAQSSITTAETNFTSMIISDPEGAKTLKLEGKSALTEARKGFSEAKKSLKDAVQAIKTLVK